MIRVPAQKPGLVRQISKIPLSGDAGWDYLTVNDATGQLYVSHGNKVQVVDLKTGKETAAITDLNGVHGIALAPKLNKGFITGGKDSSVTIFDLRTNTVIEKVKVTGANPDAILFDEFSGRVFVYNGRTSNATVIDATTNKIIATITLDGKPEFSVTDGKGKVFVNIEDKSEISMINATSLKVEHTWSISPGEEPSGLAFDPVTHRLFAVCENKMMVVVNADNGKVITTVPIGEGVDGVAFDPLLKRVYSSNGEGTLTMIIEKPKDVYEVLATAPTQRGGRTIAIDRSTHSLYIPAAEYGETPPKTDKNPHPRPAIKPGSFFVMELKFK